MTDGLAMINSTYSTNLLGYNFGSVIHSAYDIQLPDSTDNLRKLGKSKYPHLQHMQLPSRICWNDLQYTELKYNDLSNRTVIFFFFQPADGGQQLTATTSWTSLTVAITGTASISDPGPYSTKTYWIVVC
ncbi:hypothetical protein WR25_23089 [Diploscapter pachys]|uniref:Uncharacterized protein n=1 Tax=Diploscapter pachys TaxID=2018661 RepID=A0A2A2J1Z4_9BILA|nr:hypothetical protein WR25_23089 [Diploscapter pachys]